MFEQCFHIVNDGLTDITAIISHIFFLFLPSCPLGMCVGPS